MEIFGAFLSECSAVLRIRIHNDLYHFSGPGSVPQCLESGCISYSNEHSNINWKGKFNKACLLGGSCWTYSQEKPSKDVQKVLF
jgi:hypothetical protein